MIKNLVNNGWVEDIGTWIIGLVCGAYAAKRHLGKHMQRLHDRLEQIERKL